MDAVHGTVAPGFEPVREAFEANFRKGLDFYLVRDPRETALSDAATACATKVS